MVDVADSIFSDESLKNAIFMFPNASADNSRILRGCTCAFNCIAWAMGDTKRYWACAEDYHWPEGVPRVWCLDSIVQMLNRNHYQECEDGSLEPDFEKIAVYGHPTYEPDEYDSFTHLAKQEPDGMWTSKLGSYELIAHETAETLNGGAYGDVVAYFKRPRQPEIETVRRMKDENAQLLASLFEH